MATVEILIGGVDYTPHVVWATASFTAKVNGTVGDCMLQILDRDHAFTFTFGQEIQLVIDGVIRWGGTALRPQRTFVLPVVPHSLTEPRLWTLEGVDYNAVFDKRVLHDLANPGRAWNYAPGTYDDTIINDVWNYLDMGGFTKDIERVAVAILDIPGVTSKANGGLIASAGYTFRDVLASIVRNTAAIYYCSPTKVIRYLDSDSVSSDYLLTDVPGAPFTIPYREIKIREDMSAMVNDALVWGAGYGSQNIVFSRYADPDDPTFQNHGRWQSGQFTSGVYKQATADALAISSVEGSPSAHRQQKNPKRSVELVTYSTALNLGEVVTVECVSHDYVDTLPIRSVTTTFPTPYNPRFAMLLSWEVDAAWSMTDPWKPRKPKDGDKPPPGGDDPPEEKKCTDAQCGITDTFDRSDQIDVGTSTSGLVWTGYGGSIQSNKMFQQGSSSNELSTMFPFPFYSSIEVHVQPGYEHPTIRVDFPGGRVSLAWERNYDYGLLEYVSLVCDDDYGNRVESVWTGSSYLAFPFVVLLDVNGSGAAGTVGDKVVLTINYGDASPFAIPAVESVTVYAISVNSDI
jgi:hypothetical protein